jgi:hypothetical protein
MHVLAHINASFQIHPYQLKKCFRHEHETCRLRKSMHTNHVETNMSSTEGVEERLRIFVLLLKNQCTTDQLQMF